MIHGIKNPFIDKHHPDSKCWICRKKLFPAITMDPENKFICIHPDYIFIHDPLFNHVVKACSTKYVYDLVYKFHDHYLYLINTDSRVETDMSYLLDDAHPAKYFSPNYLNKFIKLFAFL